MHQLQSSRKLTNVFHTYCNTINDLLSTEFSFFPDYDKEQTAGVIGRKRVFTPPCHPILLLFFRGPWLFCSYNLFSSFLIFSSKSLRYDHVSWFFFLSFSKHLNVQKKITICNAWYTIIDTCNLMFKYLELYQYNYL